jgi:hypothetical protein
MDSSAWPLVSKEKVQRSFRSLAKWNGAKSEVEALRRMVPYSATKTQWDWCNQNGEQSMEWKWNSMIAVSSVLVHCTFVHSRNLQASAHKWTCYSI